MSWETVVLTFLGVSLVRPVIAAAVAWVGLRAFRVRHPGAEHVVWTAVLACLFLLPGASLAPRWSLHVMPARRAVASNAAATSAPAATANASGGIVRQSVPPPVDSSWLSSQSLLLAIYVAGFVGMVAYRVVGLLALRGLVARSRAIHGRLRESEELVTPVTAGVVERCVILPGGWREWPATERRAVLAHEFAHLRRGDAYVAASARLAQSIFWFHPLSWWIGRKISECAELACDTAALERSDDAAEYSRLLLGFAEAVGRSGSRLSLPGLAMAADSRIGRRIERVFELAQEAGDRGARVSRKLVLVAAASVPLACLVATVTLAEQDASHASGPIPRFEVVSVKPCTPSDQLAMSKGSGRGGGPGGRINASSGRVSVECTTADSLIRNAYLRYADGKPDPRNLGGFPMERVSHRQMTQTIQGAPGWLASERFTVDATASGTPGPQMMLGPMMQSVLAARFGLKIHTEMRETPMYALLVAKGGPKLQPTEGKCFQFEPGVPPPEPKPGERPEMACGMFWRLAGIGDGADSASMADLARALSRWLDLDVIDRTGITGLFDIRMEISLVDSTRGLSFGDPKMRAEVDAARAAETDPPGTSVYAAIEKLGLRVEQIKAPAEFLVIDHVERPSGN